MKMYMGYFSDTCDEVAILIIAHDAREAKKVGWWVMNGLCDDDGEYIHFRVRLLKNQAPHLLAALDQKKIAADIAHATEDIPGCENCEQWGSEKPIGDNGWCKECNDDLQEAKDYE